MKSNDTTKKKLLAFPKKRHAYKNNPMRQIGAYIVLNAGVSKRVANLVRTEAAINDKSVSAMLNDILESRYAKVK